MGARNCQHSIHIRLEGPFTRINCSMSREVTSGAKSRQFRSEWTPLGVHVCLDE
jgi:hypothetical protein